MMSNFFGRIGWVNIFWIRFLVYVHLSYNYYQEIENIKRKKRKKRKKERKKTYVNVFQNIVTIFKINSVDFSFFVFVFLRIIFV